VTRFTPRPRWDGWEGCLQPSWRGTTSAERCQGHYAPSPYHCYARTNRALRRPLEPGLYFTVGEVGGFTGPSLLGYLFDLTGGFVVGLVLNATLLALVALGCLRLDRERAT
jgi:hypothetical protein